MARVQELKERLEAAKKAKNDLIASISFDATNYELNIFTSQFSLITDLITRLEKEFKQAEEFDAMLSAQIKEMVDAEFELRREVLLKEFGNPDKLRKEFVEKKKVSDCIFCGDGIRILEDLSYFKVWLDLESKSLKIKANQHGIQDHHQAVASLEISNCPFCGRELSDNYV